MTLLANAGPLVIFKSNPLGAVGTGSANQNPDEAPSFEHLGSGLLDPRVPFTYYPGMGQGVAVGLAGGSPGIYGVAGNPSFAGFMGGDYVTVDQVPAAIGSPPVSIAAAQANSGTTMTLVSTSGAGITVGVSIVRADTGAVVTGLLAIDNPMAAWGFGISGVSSVWDPTRAISRAVSINSTGVDTGINFTVNGYDLYGYPLSFTMAGGSTATVTTTKAFKYVSSITHTGSIAANASAGPADIYGLPLRSDRFADITATAWNNTWLTALTSYVPAVTTNPATATTGDVRGTIGVPTGSDSTKRLTIYQAPNIMNISGAQLQSCTISSASPGVVTLNSNGFANGQPVQFFPIGGNLAPPLVPGTTYYVTNVATNTFNVAATAGGAGINTTGASAGTVNCVSFQSSNTVTGLFGVTQNAATTNGA